MLLVYYVLLIFYFWKKRNIYLYLHLHCLLNLCFCYYLSNYHKLNKDNKFPYCLFIYFFSKKVWTEVQMVQINMSACWLLTNSGHSLAQWVLLVSGARGDILSTSAFIILYYSLHVCNSTSFYFKDYCCDVELKGTMKTAFYSCLLIHIGKGGLGVRTHTWQGVLFSWT